MNFLLAGGWSTWFVLVFGTLALYTSIRFAFSADTRRLAIVRALSSATVFATLAGVGANFIAVMNKTTTIPELRDDPNFAHVVMQGLGEAISPAVLGFCFLALTWLFIAVGTRRLNDREGV
jgi:hypothetical protein